MALYREQGIVLRTYKLGEADRIVHLLTQGRGKVRAVAKGLRRPTSRFGGRLEPFSHVDLQLYEGRNLDIVTQAELLAPHAAVRADFALTACGSAMAEAADRVAQEDERSNPLFLLLLDGLRALARPAVDPAATLDVWLLRLADVAGYHPYLDACAGCGEPCSPHPVFSIAAGGLLCSACAAPGARGMEPAAVALLRRLASADLYEVILAPGEASVRRSTAALVNSFVTYHLGQPLKSWDLVPR